MADGKGCGGLQEPKGNMWEVLQDRMQAGQAVPEMRVLSWDRKRKADRPQMPSDPKDRLLHACRKSDDYAVRSREKVTWASYQKWWEVYLAFGDFMGVQVFATSEREWRRSVELLRVSVAMMADEYALGTIQIYVSAVGHHFSMRDWLPPTHATCSKGPCRA